LFGFDVCKLYENKTQNDELKNFSGPFAYVLNFLHRLQAN